jgi:hypothetical protein
MGPAGASHRVPDGQLAEVAALVAQVEAELLPAARLESLHPGEPVVAHQVPDGWDLVGTGNYAAVFAHPSCPAWVVKVYAPGRPGIEDEAEVYARLGEHPAYSRCAHVGAGYLVLLRLHGVTLFDQLRRGLPIPPSAIDEIDRALDHARAVGLFPHDVHAKNVMIDAGGRGLVVDVSDFRHVVPCTRWDDLKRAYRWLYRPLLGWRSIPLPLWLLDAVRRAYRWVRWNPSG